MEAGAGRPGLNPRPAVRSGRPRGCGSGFGNAPPGPPRTPLSFPDHHSRNTGASRQNFGAPPPSSTTTQRPLINVGDHDHFIEARRAVVTAVDKDVMTIRLGGTSVDDGWQYFGEDVKPGAAFTFTTPGYVVKGTVISLTEDAKP